MCGIVGYVGESQAAPILLEGLEKLEYRGYDSAGIAVYDGKKINMKKAMGRLKVLNELTHGGELLPGKLGIGHTRWATHGAPSDINAHPHFNKDQSIVVVHNGIIENYLDLRERLEAHGYTFHSETDTETVAHLVDYLHTGKKDMSLYQRQIQRLLHIFWIIITTEIRWRQSRRLCTVWKDLMHLELSSQITRKRCMQYVRTAR